MQEFDAIIVGGGPAGLSAALVLGRCRRRVVVFDDKNPRNARSRGVHGFLSREGISPWDLRDEARAQLAPFEVALRDERVMDVRSDVRVAPLREGCEPTSGFAVVTTSGETVRGRKLVLATGMRDEVPRLEGIEPLLGGSVHFCPYCHGWEVRDRRLAAYASGDAAVEFALGLTTWSHDIVLFTNADGSKLSADDHARLERNGVRACEERILRLEANAAGSLARVVLQRGDAISRDAMFVHAGRSQRSEFPAKLGVVLAPDGTAETGTCERTNVPGVWVVGDASRDVQFAIVAAAEGAKAAYAINRELREESCR